MVHGSSSVYSSRPVASHQRLPLSGLARRCIVPDCVMDCVTDRYGRDDRPPDCVTDRYGRDDRPPVTVRQRLVALLSFDFSEAIASCVGSCLALTLRP
jgi:hypothetical protein